MKEPVLVNNLWTISFLDQQNKWNTEEDVEEAESQIKTADCMEVLELRGNSLGIEAGERLAKALETHPELKSALWSDLFTGRLKTEIPPVLRSLCDSMISCGVRLVELDLSDNAFGPIGAEGIEKFLESSSAYSLQVLKLNNNGLGSGGKTIARALKRCCENAKADGQRFALKSFVAGRNRLEVPGAVALAEAFQAIGTLEEVVMPQNGITAKGIEALAVSFKNNLSLKVINLSDNSFTRVGAQAMAKVLPSLRCIETLHFGDCLCRNLGVLALIGSLNPEAHTRLKEVNLSGNELGVDVVEKVASTMREGFRLDALILHTNNLGGQFDAVKSRWEGKGFVDFGEESDDQGSLDGGEEEEECSNEEQSGNETDDERTEDTDNYSRNELAVTSQAVRVDKASAKTTLDDVVLFIRKPTLNVASTLVSQEAIVLNILQDELNGRTQEMTAALLYTLSTLLSSADIDRKLSASMLHFADSVMKAAEAVRRWPLSASEQIANLLLAYGGALKTESGEAFSADVRGLIILFKSLIGKGHFAKMIPTVKFFFAGSIAKAHPEHNTEIIKFLNSI